MIVGQDLSYVILGNDVFVNQLINDVLLEHRIANCLDIFDLINDGFVRQESGNLCLVLGEIALQSFQALFGIEDCGKLGRIKLVQHGVLDVRIIRQNFVYNGFINQLDELCLQTGGIKDFIQETVGVQQIFNEIIGQYAVLCLFVGKKKLKNFGRDECGNGVFVYIIQKIVNRDDRKDFVHCDDILQHRKVKVILNDLDRNQLFERIQIGRRKIVGDQCFQIVE